jgi:hypothetical protein
MTVNRETRREQLRNAATMFRRRRKYGLARLSINVTKSQLDALEVKGYLDPDRRSERADECDAIEAFLAESLAKPR